MIRITKTIIITIAVLTMLSMTIVFAGCSKKTDNPVTPTIAPTKAVEVVTNTPVQDVPTMVPTAAPEGEVRPDVDDITLTQTPEVEATVTPLGTENTKEPELTETPVTTKEAIPIATVAPIEDAEPTDAITPTENPVPTNTPEPTVTVAPTATPKPTSTPKPTVNPVPTATPRPTATPKPVLTVSETEVFAEKIAKAMDITVYGTQTYTEALVGNGLLSEEVAKNPAISRKDSFVVLHKVAEKYNALDADMMQIALERNRISDMKSCTEKEIQSAYALYSAGIVEGEMDGLYSHTRSMNPKQLLTNEDLDLYLNRITGVAEKRVLSFDGQITRTTDLPDARYAKWYAYFLESFPNEYYENEFPIMAVEVANNSYVTDELLWNVMQTGEWPGNNEWLKGSPIYFPTNIFSSPDNYDPLVDYNTKLPMEEWLLLYGEDFMDLIEEYIHSYLNVDYRETSEEWAEYVLENYYNYANSGSDEYNINRLQKQVDEYLNAIVDNKTIIECSEVDCDFSTISYTRSKKNVLCHIKYRVVSADGLKSEQFTEYKGIGYCCENNAILRMVCDPTFTYLTNSDELGKWQDAYINVSFSTTLDGKRCISSIEGLGLRGPHLYK